MPVQLIVPNETGAKINVTEKTPNVIAPENADTTVASKVGTFAVQPHYRIGIDARKEGNKNISWILLPLI